MQQRCKKGDKAKRCARKVEPAAGARVRRGWSSTEARKCRHDWSKCNAQKEALQGTPTARPEGPVVGETLRDTRGQVKDFLISE